jgi:hypothetical protein
LNKSEKAKDFNEFEDVYVIDSMPLEICKNARAARSLKKWQPEAIELIDSSFLDDAAKSEYKKLVSERVKVFE